MILKFNNFKKVNESSTEQTFMEKMEDNYEYNDIVKSVITLTIEHDLRNINDAESFEDWFLSNSSIDETDIIDLDNDAMVDLCIYYGEETGEKEVPKGTEWDTLNLAISNIAVNGMQLLYGTIVRNKFFGEFEKFMSDNNLLYENISVRSGFDYAAPKAVKTIENGEIYEFRNLDGDYNINEYVYNSSEFEKLEIYIKQPL